MGGDGERIANVFEAMKTIAAVDFDDVIVTVDVTVVVADSKNGATMWMVVVKDDGSVRSVLGTYLYHLIGLLNVNWTKIREKRSMK